jgi:hypothetical protein
MVLGVSTVRNIVSAGFCHPPKKGGPEPEKKAALVLPLQVETSITVV